MDVKNYSPDPALTVVEAIYRFFDDFIASFPVACRPGCASCCTTNLFVTTAEARLLMKGLTPEQLASVRRIVEDRPLYRPTTTTNQIARACLDHTVVEDEGEHQKGRCPFLSEDQRCTVYGSRPLACRAMHSVSLCPDGAMAAQVEPFLMEVQLVLYQVLEQLALETDGRLGNLFDLLAGSADEDQGPLLSPQPFPGVVVMPANRGRIASFLRRLLKSLDDLDGEAAVLAAELKKAVGPHVGLEPERGAQR